MEENYNPDQESALSNELEGLIQYEQATVGQRFVNWLVDNLLMQYGLSYITGVLVGYLLVYLTPDLYFELFSNNGEMTPSLLLLAYIIAIFNYLIYYSFCEKVFRGYTLGKLISGTNQGDKRRWPGTQLPGCLFTQPVEVGSARTIQRL